jgi:hypothetical protein
MAQASAKLNPTAIHNVLNDKKLLSNGYSQKFVDSLDPLTKAVFTEYVETYLIFYLLL